MDYTGLKVNHGTFGEGIVLSQDGSCRIQVGFVRDNSTKTFLTPGCFGPDGFLKLLDDDAVDRVQNELERERQEQEQEAQRRSRDVLFVTRENEPRNSSDSIVFSQIPTSSTVDEFVEAMKPALRSEIDVIKTTRRNRTKLADGKLVKELGNSYLYSFESETELNLPNNTEIDIWIPSDNKPVKGYVIDSDGFTVILSSYQDLGKEVVRVEFSTDTWKLLECLIERLDELRESPSSIVKALVCDGPSQIVPEKDIKKGQDTALQMSSSQPITFIWGPPGTGKTETLAKIAIHHISQGQRVLMLSHSNVSVDGATWRVFKKDIDPVPGRIIRCGYPKNKKLLDHDFLTSYSFAIKSHPDLVKTRNALLDERRKYPRTSATYIEIGKKLISIKAQLDEEEKQAVRNAQFVATTVSKAVVDKNLFQAEYDVVFFDEASMAYIPQIVFSASLATSSFVCLGDFSQLPPIVQSENARILNCDIFQYCGIVQAVYEKACHEWLCLLDTQYRMHPVIADYSSATMYQGLLQSGKDMEKKRESIVNAEPFSGDALHLVDLSGMYTLCKKVNDGSRINILSAFVSMGLAIVAATNNEVGVITPYKAQSRLLHAMSQDLKEQNSDIKEITCATVHQFQGSEKNVIIYDAVDCYVQKYPGILLTEMNNNDANRLFNVAITRARGKFIAITHVNYMKSSGRLNNKLIFKRLLNKLISSGKRTSGLILLSKLGSDYLSSFNEANGMTAFLSDIKNATQSISITIPQGFNSNDEWINKLSSALSEARDRNVRVIIQANKKTDLPQPLRKFAIANRDILDPIMIIDRRITWYGVPKAVGDYIVNNAQIKTIYHPLLRFEGQHFAQTLAALNN